MLGTSEGRGQAVHHRAARISARSHAISNAKFCGRENFSKISVANRTQSHAPQHADAPHSCSTWIPFRAVRMLSITAQHGFRRDRTRFRTQNFAAAKIILRKFRSQIARNLTRRSMPTLGIDVGDLRGSWASCAPPSGTDFGAISRDLERKILRPRKFFENFGRKSHAISRAAACRRSAQLFNLDTF